MKHGIFLTDEDLSKAVAGNADFLSRFRMALPAEDTRDNNLVKLGLCLFVRLGAVCVRVRKAQNEMSTLLEGDARTVDPDQAAPLIAEYAQAYDELDVVLSVCSHMLHHMLKEEVTAGFQERYAQEQMLRRAQELVDKFANRHLPSVEEIAAAVREGQVKVGSLDDGEAPVVMGSDAPPPTRH